jgi:hypothetical protein
MASKVKWRLWLGIEGKITADVVIQFQNVNCFTRAFSTHRMKNGPTSEEMVPFQAIIEHANRCYFATGTVPVEKTTLSKVLFRLLLVKFVIVCPGRSSIS